MKKIAILFLFWVLVFSTSCQSGSGEMPLLRTNNIGLMSFGNRDYLMISAGKRISLLDLVSYEKVYTSKKGSEITAIYCHENILYLGTKNGELYSDSFSFKSQKLKLTRSEIMGKFKSAVVEVQLVDNGPVVYLANNDFLYLNQKGTVIKQRKIKVKNMQINNSGIAFLDSKNKLHFINHNAKKKSYVMENVLGYSLSMDKLFFSDFRGSVYNIHLERNEIERLKNFNTPYSDPISKLFVSRNGQYIFAIAGCKKNKSLFMSYDLFSGRIFYQPIKGQVENVISYDNNRYTAFLLKKNVKIRGFQADKKVIVKTIYLNLL